MKKVKTKLKPVAIIKVEDNFDKLDKFQHLEDAEKEEKFEDEYVIEEDKFVKPNTLRKDHELFDDGMNVVHKIISVKRVSYKTGEDWEIRADDDIVLTLKGVRFTSKEKDFFRTVAGIQYIIAGYKSGWKSISDFKKNLIGKI